MKAIDVYDLAYRISEQAHKGQLDKGGKPYGENVPFVPPLHEQKKAGDITSAYITPDYETISTIEKSRLVELVNSSLLNGFNQQDLQDVASVFNRVCDRLILIAEQEEV